jgi:hypothetical protein
MYTIRSAPRRGRVLRAAGTGATLPRRSASVALTEALLNCNDLSRWHAPPPHPHRRPAHRATKAGVVVSCPLGHPHRA